MYFRKLKIENFRSHVDTVLDLERLTVIRGTNGAGKSSIEQAIQITIAGRADGTTSDGKGSVGLIRAGASKALITLAAQVVSDGAPTERILKCALNDTRRTILVTKADDPAWSGGADWSDWLETHRETLSCLVNNRHFVELSPDAQADVLAAIILPKQYTWADWVMPACHDLSLKINWAKTPFEVIAQAHDVAFKERTNINRDVKNFKAPEGDTAAAANYEEIQAKLTARQGELESAKKRKFTAESETRSNATLRTSAEDRLRAAQGRLSREQQELPAIEAALLSKDKVKDHEKTAKAAAKAKSLDEDIVRIGLEIAAKKEALKALDKLGDRCPTCATELTSEVLKTISQPILDARNKLDDEHKAAVKARKDLGNPAEAQSALEAHAKAQTDLKRAQERIAEEQTAISDAEAAIAGIPRAEAVDTAALDGEIAELAAKVEKGQTLLNAARSAKELLARKESAQKDFATLQKKQAQLNRLVEYFGDEVKAQLLAASVGPFTAAMNAVLAQWGYQCVLTFDPYCFAIKFYDSDRHCHEIPLKHLSRSERYRFATAFQVALAIVSGFKFVIVDEADIFDSKGRAGLFAALTSGELDQAIVMSTDERLNVPAQLGTVFYRFDDVAQPGQIPTTQVRKLLPAAQQAA